MTLTLTLTLILTLALNLTLTLTLTLILTLTQNVESLNAGHKIEWDGKLLEIKVPANKMVLGHPATPAAAPARKPPEWQADPEKLAAKYKETPALMATKGVMTWSVGHDYSNGWAWVKAMKTIWDD